MRLRAFVLRTNGKVEEVRPPGGRDFLDLCDAEVRARIVSFSVTARRAWVEVDGEVRRQYPGGAVLQELVAAAKEADEEGMS